MGSYNKERWEVIYENIKFIGVHPLVEASTNPLKSYSKSMSSPKLKLDSIQTYTLTDDDILFSPDETIVEDDSWQYASDAAYFNPENLEDDSMYQNQDFSLDSDKICTLSGSTSEVTYSLSSAPSWCEVDSETGNFIIQSSIIRN